MDRVIAKADAAAATASSPAAVPARASPRHTRLRAATASAHARVDGLIGARHYFETPEQFRTYLSCMRNFHAAFDAASSPIDPGWCSLWKTDRLAAWAEDDLLSSGGKPERGQTQPMPGFVSPSALLGALYVVAGSALGARVLHRLSVERHLPATGGSQYLHALAHAVRWSDFIVFLESSEIASEDEMVEGALATFASAAHFLQGGHPA
jgi:heme oxygenase